MTSNDSLPNLSVVVIGRNEGVRLIKCLESVLDVDYPQDKIELIYIDSDSTDDSCACAQKLGARVIIIKPEKPTAATARNAGLRAASYELIQFLDGDTILNRSWLRHGIASINDPRISVTFGRVEEVFPKATLYNYWMHHDWYIPPGKSETCGGIALFRRDVVMKSGGYDSSLIAGEERDLCFRMRRDQDITILCLDEPMVLHDIHMTSFTQYWKRCQRSGYAYAQIGARYQKLYRWRRTCRHNLVHALAFLSAISVSVIYWTILPFLIWLVMVMMSMVRDTVRCRNQVGSISGSLVCAIHHYLSKAPIVVGHLAYYRDSILGRVSPQDGKISNHQPDDE